MRTFLDANVLFSACLRERSRQHAFFALARSGHCRLTTSAYALDDVRRDLTQKAPSRLIVLEVLTRLIEPSAQPSGELVSRMLQYGLPDKDAPILAAAIAARADILMTGDRRHFGPLFGREIEQVRVLSLVDGLAALIAHAGEVPD
jgi:predicted nucleic acid-binding protein